MTSGYRAMGDEPRGDYRHGPSLTPFKPDPEPLFSPGKKFAYWDSAMNEFANVLTRIAVRPLEHLFAERIAEPIGLQDHEWHWGDLGEHDGKKINSGAGNHASMEISSLSIARFGYLFLRMGEWEGRQLISRSWIEQATAVQVQSEVPLAGYIDHGPGTYGYNWWVNGTGPGGNLKWPDIPRSAWSASGYNNNDMFVIPEWGMVIVRLGLDQSDHLITDEEYNRFLYLVGESIID
jgi:CubicO group peptidase (beta-lactamase class C family)